MKIKTLLLAAIVAAGCSQFTQTSFANGDQSVPSDEQNIPGVAPQPDSYFYTGKVYDAELEGYVFAARVLNPETGRWNTPDPSGFPDGPNNRIYAPVPTNEIDPTGLLSVKNFTYTPQNYVGNSNFKITYNSKKYGNGYTVAGDEIGFQIKWDLSVSSSLSGWIVQHVAWNTTNAIDAKTQSSQDLNDGWWEAWKISKGEFIGFGAAQPAYDQYSALIKITDNGSLSINGNITFYQNDFFNKKTGNDNPNTWSPNEPNTFAGALPVTTSEPDWWGDDPTYTHNLSFNWKE